MSHAESETKFASSVCVNKSRNVRSVKKSSGCVSFVMGHTSFALIDKKTFARHVIERNARMRKWLIDH